MSQALGGECSGQMKDKPKIIDGCQVFVGAQLESCDSHGNETGRLSNWFLVFPVDETDDRIWEWNQRTGVVRECS